MRYPSSHGVRVLLALAAPVLASIVAAQAVAPRLPADRLDGSPLAEVLVVGTYHMGNPGRDIVNMKADDVLAPKRQQEIREVVEVLARFRPTKVAVEADPGGPRIQAYEDYLAGTYELKRDERDQIAFRLAKELSHPRIYGIDVEGEFPYAAVQDFAKAHGRGEEIEGLMGRVRSMVQEQNDFLGTHTVLEMLLRINSGDAVRRNLAAYAMYAHFGAADEYDYPGAELLAQWYRRNMRIHSNLVEIAQPGDRLLVVYGSGHLGLLQQAVQADPTLKLRTLAELAAALK
jgi:hypothetical protein